MSLVAPDTSPAHLKSRWPAAGEAPLQQSKQNIMGWMNPSTYQVNVGGEHLQRGYKPIVGGDTEQLIQKQKVLMPLPTCQAGLAQ